jgi:NADH dehydrogenase
MGVDVRLNTAAIGMSLDSITVKDPEVEEQIPARTKIWAAGVRASPLAKMLAEATGTETDRAGRVAVLPDCSLPGHPEVFAVGDMITLNQLPGVAQPAIQEGRYVGKLIRARLDGSTQVKPFSYQGQHGHDRPPVRDHGLLRHEVHRRARLHDVGIRPRALSDRLGQPAGSYLFLGRALTFAKDRAHRVITFEQAAYELTQHAAHSETPDGPRGS